MLLVAGSGYCFWLLVLEDRRVTGYWLWLLVLVTGSGGQEGYWLLILGWFWLLIT